jgi:hypothetical protein
MSFRFYPAVCFRAVTGEGDALPQPKRWSLREHLAEISRKIGKLDKNGEFFSSISNFLSDDLSQRIPSERRNR